MNLRVTNPYMATISPFMAKLLTTTVTATRTIRGRRAVR